MNRKLFLIPLLLLGIFVSNAQQFPVNFRLTTVAGYNGPDRVPFWMRSNQFGSVPPAEASIGLIGSAYKPYNSTTGKKFDWGLGAEGRLNIGNPSKFILLEGYGKIRYGIFEFKAGRVKEITGLCDTLLSSGSWSVSGNALGIPKIQISVPDFYTLPFLGRLFAFKGNYVHGWMGNWYLEKNVIDNTPTYLHQKSLYGRFGKPGWKLKLYGGFNHQVVWGDEKDILLGEDYELNLFRTFLYVNTGKRYNNERIAETRVGNHLGSIDAALSYDFDKVKVFAYHQFLYDAGALYYLANLMDGLNGISVQNLQKGNGTFHWNRFLVEFLYTKNQAGEKWSRYTTSPVEGYYNNGYYPVGWSYRNTGIGNPFVTPKSDLSKEFPSAPEEFFINNRVAAIHCGFEGAMYNLHVTTRLSYSRNFGTYRTALTGKDFEGAIYPSPYGVFPEVGQFSGMLQITKIFAHSFQMGLTGAIDMGSLFKNCAGFEAVISKSM